MNSNLTGKQRLLVVTGAVWILSWLFALTPWRWTFPHGNWMPFLVVGVAPIAIWLTFIWVRRGFQNDKEAQPTMTPPPYTFNNDKERGARLWGALRISNYINSAVLIMLFAVSLHYVVLPGNGEQVFFIAVVISHLNSLLSG